jgi:hypothetical protein
MNKQRRELLRVAAAGLGGLFAIVLGAFALAPLSASATPNKPLLTFEGAHVVDPSQPFGLRHDGRFTASAPFCSAGRAHDVQQADDAGTLMVWRLHTCDDGSGSFTVFLPTVRNEHAGTGTWKVVEGTGRYTALRGVGTYTGTVLSGDPANFATVTYQTDWQGLVDFDADPPAIESFNATARKLRLPRRTYLLRVAVTAQDPSTPIQFLVTVSAGRNRLSTALRTASTATGRAVVNLRINPPTRTRNVQIALTTTDALGNTSTSSRSVKLG